MAAERRYDLYLLLDTDVPFVEDWQRPDGHRREEFFARFRGELESRNRNYIVISGAYEQRLAQSVKAIDGLFSGVEKAEKG